MQRPPPAAIESPIRTKHPVESWAFLDEIDPKRVGSPTRGDADLHRQGE
jgi:hypothetical protein